MSLSPRPRYTPALRGRRVLITGAARGIGAGLADLLTAHGAQVALAGLEPALLSEVAARNHAPWRECDVSDPAAVDGAVDELVTELGGLDIVVANAGIAKQLPIIGGQSDVMEAHLRVNTLGVFYTLRAAGPHILHPSGYALATASLAAAVHLPLLGAYSASKAAVEAIGNTFRLEIQPSGATARVAYYSELATDMTTRGFDTRAGQKLTGGGTISGIAPLESALRALERGIARRSRRIAAPGWVSPLIPLRHLAQRVAELKPLPDLEESLAIARTEQVPLHDRATLVTARIRPGTLRDLGPLRWGFTRAAGRVMGTGPPAVFTTLGRTRGLFTGWLHFAGRLMPFGRLERRESELVILTVATARGCVYEQEHHRRLGRRAGLTRPEIEGILAGTEVTSLSPRERALRESATLLVRDQDLDDAQWSALRRVTSEREAIELLLLVGHYDMLATTLMTLRLEPDPRR